jgi:cation/acetate symporter
MKAGTGGSSFGGWKGIGWAAAAGFAALAAAASSPGGMGIPPGFLALALLGAPLLAYVAAGLASRARGADDFLVAGRGVGPAENGAAAAAGWISAATFVGLAGTLYAQGEGGLAFVLGWAGGSVLTGLLIAPGLRRSGARSVPEFLALRFGGGLARTVGVVVLAWCSFGFLVAQFAAVGAVGARFLGVPYDVAVAAGALLALACVLPGGMRSLTRTQSLQLAVLGVAYLLPAGLIWWALSADPALPWAYAEALAGGAGAAGEGTGRDAVDLPALLLCLALGTASLPHVLMRFLAAPTPGAARRTVGWSLVLALAIYLAAPAYAAFAKLQVQGVVGARVDTLEAARALPRWVYEHGRLGLVAVCGRPPVTAGSLLDACRSAQGAAVAEGTLPPEATGAVGPGDVAVHPDLVVLGAPAMAGLPAALGALLAAGALAAALSTAGALLMALGSAAGHDVWHGLVAPKAPPPRRLLALRIACLGVAGIAAWVAAGAGAGVLATVGWAFSLSASGLFPALALGIWWRRCTAAGAVAGMLAGFGTALWYVLRTETLGLPPILGLDGAAAGVFGVPAGFLVMAGISLLTRAPGGAQAGPEGVAARPAGGVATPTAPAE